MQTADGAGRLAGGVIAIGKSGTKISLGMVIRPPRVSDLAAEIEPRSIERRVDNGSFGISALADIRSVGGCCEWNSEKDERSGQRDFYCGISTVRRFNVIPSGCSRAWPGLDDVAPGLGDVLPDLRIAVAVQPRVHYLQ
jgi:hypothetical protein